MKIFPLQHYNLYLGNIQEALITIPWQDYSQVIVLCDEQTEVFCLPKIQHFFEKKKYRVLTIQSGEQHKKLTTCEKIWTQMIDFQVDRKAILLNLGGGVIGDMGGFCASTFKRGFDFIQIPTTLLAQVDASIGGKLGIDFKGIKNAIGVFQDPKAVWIDPDFLTTLSERELRSGFAEILKHALIADKKVWKKLSSLEKWTDTDWNTTIALSLMVKKNIVEKDPFEKNIRKALNFGHTMGHAVESYFLNSNTPLLHGEAIAIGMICESFLSFKKELLSEEELKNITTFLLKTFGKVTFLNNIYPELFAIMQQDKKNEDNRVNFTFLDGIGAFQINHSADCVLIAQSLDFYNAQ